MKYDARIEDGKLIIDGEYHQDGGWYVIHTLEGGWSLYEVPLYGGHGQLSGRFDTFPEAAEYAKENLI